MLITRKLKQQILDRINQGKAIILIGARQVGKSTLFNEISKRLDGPILTLNCDNPETRDLLNEPSSYELKLLVGNNKVIMIDEAQRIYNIGMTLKRIIDQYPGTQLLITGSSSLELHNKLNEPLTGRKFEYYMYPLSSAELYDSTGLTGVKQLLDSRMIYGSYPDIITHPENAKELILSLSNSYLYKDILEMDSVRRPALLDKLLIALSLQIGSEVSYNEIAQTIGSDTKTVERYIDLLEKCFVVKKIDGLSRNMRNELKKSKKIYFYDNGVRNAIIQNFAPLKLRNDNGALWENFFIMERMKYNAYRNHSVNYYFWRTTSQQEIDLIEESDGVFTIFEMKWNPNRNATFPKSFLENYTVAASHIITPDNYLEFLLP